MFLSFNPGDIALQYNHRERLELLESARAIARTTGILIMRYYQGERRARQKEDRTPVTEADIAAHHAILEQLRKLTPDIPVVSEEGEGQALPTARYWLVDPLDGTKSFVRGSGEFTVNIALMENNYPMLGAIYAPLHGMDYYGSAGERAWRCATNAIPEPIQCRLVDMQGLNLVESHAHLSPKMESFLKPYRIAQRSPVASAIKFCWVAEGRADMYPRLGPTMEWDTAAGHAIVLGAGGSVERLDGAPLTYGKPGWQNPHFVVWGRRS